MYSKKVIDHFQNPKNVGELNDADGIGKVGNVSCGDVMYLYIKVKDEKITEIKFKTMGCAAAISTSDVVCDLAKGKAIGEALKLKKCDIVDFLGGLPALKIHCSVLAIDALHEAIYDYMKKSNKDIPEDLQKEHERHEKSLHEVNHNHG